MKDEDVFIGKLPSFEKRCDAASGRVMVDWPPAVCRLTNTACRLWLCCAQSLFFPLNTIMFGKKLISFYIKAKKHLQFALKKQIQIVFFSGTRHNIGVYQMTLY